MGNSVINDGILLRFCVNVVTEGIAIAVEEIEPVSASPPQILPKDTVAVYSSTVKQFSFVWRQGTLDNKGSQWTWLT